MSFRWGRMIYRIQMYILPWNIQHINKLPIRMTMKYPLSPYRRLFRIDETLEYVSVHWQQTGYQLWVNFFLSWRGFLFHDCWISEAHFAEAAVTTILTIRPWQINQRQIGTSRKALDTGHVIHMHLSFLSYPPSPQFYFSRCSEKVCIQSSTSHYNGVIWAPLLLKYV